MVGPEQAHGPLAQPSRPAVEPVVESSRGRRYWTVTTGLLLTDALMVAASFYVSWVIRYRFEIGPEKCPACGGDGIGPAGLARHRVRHGAG